MLYLSETATHWTGVTLEPVLFPEGSDQPISWKPVWVDEDDSEHQLHALLIAYDEHGLIKSHAIQRIGNRSLADQQLENLCIRYFHGDTKP